MALTTQVICSDLAYACLDLHFHRSLERMRIKAFSVKNRRGNSLMFMMVQEWFMMV